MGIAVLVTTVAAGLAACSADVNIRKMAKALCLSLVLLAAPHSTARAGETDFEAALLKAIRADDAKYPVGIPRGAIPEMFEIDYQVFERYGLIRTTSAGIVVPTAKSAEYVVNSSLDLPPGDYTIDIRHSEEKEKAGETYRLVYLTFEVELTNMWKDIRAAKGLPPADVVKWKVVALMRKDAFDRTWTAAGIDLAAEGDEVSRRLVDEYLKN